MNESILYYEVITNQLNSTGNFIGKLHHSAVVDNDILIKEMVTRNSTVTKQEAAAVISLYEELIREYLHKGNIVSTNIFQANLSMRGQFEHFDDKIDYKKHKADVVIKPAKGLNKELQKGLRFHKSREPGTRYGINHVIDHFSGSSSHTITSGGTIDIKGTALKVYGYDAEYELTLKRKDSSSDKSVFPLRIINITPAKITAVVPMNIPAGDYGLRYTAKYGSVERDYGLMAVEVIAGAEKG